MAASIKPKIPLRDLYEDVLCRLKDGYAHVLVVSDDKSQSERFISSLLENKEREFLNDKVKSCSSEEYNLYFCNKKSFSRLEQLKRRKTRLIMLDEIEVVY
jgi:hypothetical protein